VAALAVWSARELRTEIFASGWTAAAEAAAALAIFGFAAWTLRGWSRVALLLFALCDYKAHGVNRHFNTRDGNVDQDYSTGAIRGVNPEAWRAMRENRQYRVTSDGAPAALEFRVWGLATPQGLDPLLPARYRERVEQWGAQFQTTRVFTMNYGNTEMLQELGVRYAISYNGAPNEPFLAASPDFRLVGPDNSFYRVYEYLGARPAYEWAGDATPVGWTAERRVFRVRSERGGRFGLVETFFPGWRVRVDGREATLEQWRGLFQSVEVPAGEHDVEFDYRSRWLGLGAAISLLAWVALACVIYRRRNPKRAG
jgi:hypothetical protein